MYHNAHLCVPGTGVGDGVVEALLRCDAPHHLCQHHVNLWFKTG